MKTLPLLLLFLPAIGFADKALVATAANFRPTLETIAGEFESTTPHTIDIVSGSTGQLYAQILNGAPFDVFLAADQERPQLLENGPFAVADSRMTYAIGRLALVSNDTRLLKHDADSTLSQTGIGKLAIANPAVAPYGVASKQILQSLHLGEDHFGVIVLGENVAQAMTMVRTGNVDLGLVSLSLAASRTSAGEPRYVVVPGEWHDPVRQDAILLSRGRDNEAAIAFLRFLGSTAGRSLIEASGYGVD